ncbi:hypothetical protein ACLMJK_008156 [Lecanora helva]
MLEDIDELRTVILEDGESDHVDSNGNGNSDETSCVLFGEQVAESISFQQVLSKFLPPRAEADRLIATYFRAKAVVAPFIHSMQFRGLYKLFWNDPSSASPLWTAMLFTVLDISTRTLSANPNPGAGEINRSDRFATAAAHCLAIGAYHKPQQFVVEALLLYVQSVCLTTVDMPPVVGILMSTVVRLATIMGYHRDPDGYKGGISVFEGEMRRRTWSHCLQMDMLVSFQFGIPANVQFPTWDTRQPTNLLDTDFDENTVSLPPARPESEPTELRFYIAKHRLMTIFEKVIRHTLSTRDQPEDEVVSIEQELRDTYINLPAVFHPRSMEDSVIDPPSIIVARLCVTFIYQKSLCVLHRKYVARGRQSSIFRCHASASDLVRQMADIHKKFEPDGQLCTERWFMGSITWHDFLLGCTALCLVLCSVQRHATELSAVLDIAGSLNLLREAKTVCEEHLTRSKDTRKVHRMLDVSTQRFSSFGYGGNLETQSFLQNGHDLTFDEYCQTMLSAEGSTDWLWNENTIAPFGNSGWTLPDQTLDFANGDFIASSY